MISSLKRILRALMRKVPFFFREINLQYNSLEVKMFFTEIMQNNHGQKILKLSTTHTLMQLRFTLKKIRQIKQVAAVWNYILSCFLKKSLLRSTFYNVFFRCSKTASIEYKISMCYFTRNYKEIYLHLVSVWFSINIGNLIKKSCIK